MKLNNYFIMAACCGLVACTQVAPGNKKEATDKEATAEVAHGENIFHAHIAASSLSTELTHEEDFGQIIRSVGQILPAQGLEKSIIAKMPGIVSFGGRQLTAGLDVHRDQVLFSILSEGSSDDNLLIRYKEAESNYHLAEEEFRRKSSLAEKQIVSRSEMLEAKRDFETAEVRYLNLKEHFQSGQQKVISGMDGFIQEILVREGDYVREGQVVATISQNRTLLVEAQVPAKYYTELKYIHSANFHPRNGDQTYSLEELDGRLLSYSKAVSTDQPLLTVTFQIANKNQFVAGSFMDIYMHSEKAEKVISVPNSALIEQMGSYAIFLQHDENHFEKRMVEVGKTDGHRTVILEGLGVNEKVVTKGAILLKLAQATGKLDPHAGHAH